MGVERLTLLVVIFEISDCDLVLDHYKRVSGVSDADMEMA